MIPQSFKDIVSNVENAGFFQTLAMIIKKLNFLIKKNIIINKQKNYYKEKEKKKKKKDEDENQTL